MHRSFFLLALINLFAVLTFSQTTEFNYQGNLKDGANPANANYDLEFRLFAADTGGTALGTLQRLNVPVANGAFSVKLDFGAQFPGANRWLEIAVRPAGGGSFTTLVPRQLVSTTPYSVRSINAATADSSVNSLSLGGVAANQYVLTTDPRMTDARSPTAGSSNYIQNSLAEQSANFNISGTGTAGGTLSGNIVNAGSYFSIAGNHALSASGSNLHLGFSGSPAAVSGNVFAGFNVGLFNQGGGNAFFGSSSGSANTTGSFNSFFGSATNPGQGTGWANTTGSFNSFFGHRAGEVSNGNLNSFFGTGAGFTNSSGSSNTFIGHDAGNFNSTGSFITTLGENADVGAVNLTNATALGSKALVTQSNSLVLGSINGVNGASANASVGIGTTSPAERLHVVSGSADIRLGSPSGADGIEIASGVSGYSPTLWLTHTGTGGRKFRLASYGDNVNPGGFVIRDETAGKDRLTINHTGRLFVTRPFGSGNISGLTFQQESNVFPNLMSGLSYEDVASGMAINLGINSGREGPVYSSEPGFFLRMTTGPQTFNGFQFFRKAATSGTETTLASIDQSGNLSAAGGTVTGSLTVGGDVGIGVAAPTAKLHVSGGFLRLDNLGGSGITSLCWNAASQISFCSSSSRYKNHISALTSGRSLIGRLRPVTFNWKADNTPDLGLVAEEVAEVEPLLVTRNDKGQVEGVKYDRIGVLLINAVKEQQAEIESQQKTIETQQKQIEVQQRQIDALVKVVCSANPSASICERKE